MQGIVIRKKQLQEWFYHNTLHECNTIVETHLMHAYNLLHKENFSSFGFLLLFVALAFC